ncbi:hypothetical protein [Pseudomonas sp. NPDC089758]|uniref:hypothetical protein n=1 Tax=Pseudomonas sp. NPDC089758 TaxID=3364473 RepID=UPI00380CBBB3
MAENQPTAPMTIIAIFAGIIEASALATLPFLSEKSQSLYTWFLVGFPFFLTGLFFLTLNFNYKSLYKPESTSADEATSAPQPTTTVLPVIPSSASSVQNARQPSLEAEPVTVMLSGPDAQRMIEQHVLRTLAQPHVNSGTWVYCNLDKQQCFRVSVCELPENAAHLKN